MDQPGTEMRASDRERRSAIQVLRGQLREGRLSDVTFVRRLFLALDARRRDDLDALMSDLPDRRPLWQRWRPAYRRLTTGLAARIPRTFPQRRRPVFCQLALPPVPGRYVIGRSDDVDLRLDDISVSRRHALMAYIDGTWVLSDLGSRNGTWVNGWRLPGPAPVAEGDLLDVGNCRFVVVDRTRFRAGETTAFLTR